MISLFDMGSTFLLLLSHFSRKKYVSYFILLYCLIWVFLYAFYGRRGGFINSLLVLIFMVLMRIRSTILRQDERFKIYFLGLLIVIIFLAFGYLITSTYVFQRGFSREAFEASRATVFEDYFNDFNLTKDWVFGRGINGTILRSLVDSEQSHTIENGFLVVLLKGGLVYLVPFLLILLRASYLGVFRSNNDLARALGYIIFLYVILMSAFNLPSYSVGYIIVWISASACYTKSLRDHSNLQVYQAINSHFRKGKHKLYL
jgi:hypothetical protein